MTKLWHSARHRLRQEQALKDWAENLQEQVDETRGALNIQVGGDHYKRWPIQPVEFIHANGIPFIEGNCIKYLLRWRDKNGIKDLEKVKHYVDLLIELENKRDGSS